MEKADPRDLENKENPAIMDERSMIREQDRLVREQKRKKNRNKKRAAGAVVLVLAAGTAWYLLWGRNYLTQEQENGVVITATAGQEIVYATLDSVKGNEILYTIAEPVESEQNTDTQEDLSEGSSRNADTDLGQNPFPGRKQGVEAGIDTAQDGEGSRMEQQGQSSDGIESQAKEQGNRTGGRNRQQNSQTDANTDSPVASDTTPEQIQPEGNNTADPQQGQEKVNVEGQQQGQEKANAEGGQQAELKGSADAIGQAGIVGSQSVLEQDSSEGSDKSETVTPNNLDAQGITGQPGESGIFEPGEAGNRSGMDGSGLNSANSGMMQGGMMLNGNSQMLGEDQFAYENTIYKLTDQTLSAQIPVGTTVTTKLGTVTTFSRLAAGDRVALVMESDGSDKIITAVYIIG